jgi:cell division septal protein FtsQ
MHRSKDKKKYFLFLFLSLFFLSSINSQLFIEKKQSLYNLKSIEVIGLEKSLNFEIEQNLNFLLNTNIFFIDKEILNNQLDNYNFIENYSIFKFYPSKIILKLKHTNFLARTIKNNEIFLIGSNNKFVNIKKYNNFNHLPIVFGNFSAEEFLLFKKIINNSDLKYDDIKEIFFYPSQRIDIKTKDNFIIKFPAKNIKKAMNIASKIIKNEKFNNNIIDLRVPNQIILSNE